jgi:hypothetical protein
MLKLYSSLKLPGCIEVIIIPLLETSHQLLLSLVNARGNLIAHALLLLEIVIGCSIVLFELFHPLK